MPAIDLFRLTATILSGQSLSDAVVVNGLAITGIIMPAAWDAAVLSIQASLDGTTFRDAYDNIGTEIQLGAAAGRQLVIPLMPAIGSPLLAGFQYLKLRSGTAAAPVVQSATRTINLLLRRVR